MLGDHETEAETVRHGLEYYEAGNPGLLGSELSALAALGRVGEVDRLLDQVTTLEPTPRDAPRLPAGARQPPPSPRTRGPRVGPGWLFVQTAIELRGHGYDQASRAVLERLHRWADDRTPDEASEEGHRLAVATGLYLAERWDTAQASFEALAAASPRNPDLQGYLGTIAARRGDRAEALRISQWLEGPDLRGRSETRTLWRARIAALLGDPQLAMELLTDAFDEGLGFVGTRLAEGSRIVAVWLHTDMDLESLHDRADFQELLEPRG